MIPSKDSLRQQVRSVLRSMTAPQRAHASEQACHLLQQQPLWRTAKSILFYAPLPEELDVWPAVAIALAEGKTAALPRFNPESGGYIPCQVSDLAEDLRAGKFGIREPAGHCAEVTVKGLDLILAPGVAFDSHGRRLGRGKGFYDQLLANVRGTICGVAFDEQIVQEIPVRPHDISVNCILTPSRWIEL